MNFNVKKKYKKGLEMLEIRNKIRQKKKQNNQILCT